MAEDVHLFSSLTFFLEIINSPFLYCPPRVMKEAELIKTLPCLQAKWSSGERLWQRRRDQNHPEDHLSRGSHPEAWKLREKLALCFFCFQTAGLQVAPTDGLQGETGKSNFRHSKNSERTEHTATPCTGPDFGSCQPMCEGGSALPIRRCYLTSGPGLFTLQLIFASQSVKICLNVCGCCFFLAL